ncbi:MAG TPA: DUF6350 family protein [Marmoricola sp.]|nr:DUF6350 family protein [Marmoricola sp.]
MTDLLTPVLRRARPDGAEPVHRSPAVRAATAGLAAPGAVLLLLWAVGLVGWFAADGGSHGTTRSVLRVAADGWLLAHGASLTLDPAVVTASPLGLTLLCLYAAHRFGRWAGRPDPDLGTTAFATIVLAGVYGVVALLTALLASAPGADPALGQAFLGGVVVGAVGGGSGLLLGAGQASQLRRRVPVPALAVAYGAVGAVVLLAAAGAFLVAVALAVRLPAAAEVADQLQLDLTGGLFSLLLLAGIAPNLALLAASYLVGPGFAVGAGTVVSPAEVAVGPLPSVPVLAALPPDGWAPGWLGGLLAAPVLAGVASAWVAGRTLPTSSYRSGALRGLGAGAAGAALLGVLAATAGGSIGPGRMAETGIGFWGLIGPALAAIGLGGALGGLLSTWRTRRHGDADARHPPPQPEPPVTRPVTDVPPPAPEPLRAADLSTEDTVRLRLPPDR